MLPLDEKTYADWRGGQNTKLAPRLLKPSELTLARNTWYDARGDLEKRPGYVRHCPQELFPPSARITGGAVYPHPSGTSVVAYWRNGSLILDTACGLSIPPLCSGFSGTAFMEMETAKSRLHGVNGTQSFVYDGTTAFTALGLTAPSSAPSVAAGGAGPLTGSFRYKVTFTYGARGESNPGPTSGTVVLAAQEASLTSIPLGGTGCTARDIYRTTNGGATWYWVATISNNSTTTYTDSTLDSALGDEVETNHDAPPPAKYLRWWKNMMAYAGNPSAPKRVYLSLIGQPEAVPALTHYIDVPVAGDEVTGLGIAGDDLIVFTNASFFALSGGSVETFRFRIVEQSIGCTAPRSVAIHGGGTYFLFYEKVYRTMGGPAVYLSDNVDSGWVPGLKANLREAVATVWRNHLLVGIFTGTTAWASKTGAADDTSANNRVYGLDLALLELAEELRETAWFEWTNMFPSCFVVRRGPAEHSEDLWWGSNRTNGLLYKQSEPGPAGGFADDGAAIAWRIQSAGLVGDDPHLVKKAKRLEVLFTAAAGQTVRAEYRKDGASAWTTLGATASLAADAGAIATARWKFPGGQTHHYLEVALEESSTSYLKFQSMKIGHVVVRRMRGG